MIGKYRVSRYHWASIVRQVLQGISFLDQLTILHNNIKADHFILLGKFRTAVKIIEFGNSTLLSNPLKYSLNHAERMKFGKCLRHLAYELWHKANTYQSILWDTYWIGYIFQLVGVFEKFDFFQNVGKRMKIRSPMGRMSIDAAEKELKKFIQSYTF